MGTKITKDDKCISCNYYCEDEMTKIHYCRKFSEFLWEVGGNDGNVFRVTEDFYCGLHEDKEWESQ